MENTNSPSSQNTTNRSGMKIFIGMLWIASLLIAVFIGFLSGQGSRLTETSTEKNASMATTNQITNTPTSNIQVTPMVTVNQITSTPIPNRQATPTITNNNICSKSGFAQKWEYLTSYVVKENDTLQSVASSQLNDPVRVNEIMQLNGVGQLIVGSTLYLPPPGVTKSSGNIRQVSGRLVERNDVSWHLSFNGDINGQGIIIPSYWFAEIQHKDAYKIGDCLTILLDDGYKVFSVSLE